MVVRSRSKDPAPKDTERSAVWKKVTARINAEVRAGTLPTRPPDLISVHAAYRRDPVGRLRSDPWVRFVCSQPPLPDGRYIDALIKIANGDPVSLEEIFSLQSGVPIKDDEFHRAVSSSSDEVWLKRWREPLRIIAKSQRRAGKTLRPRIQRFIADNAIFLPVSIASRESPRHRLLASTAGDRLGVALSYALLLLLDEKGPGRRLCQCSYRECGRFFLAPEKRSAGAGRLKLDYCPGTNHRTIEQRLKGVERARDWRKEHPKKGRKAK